MHHIFSPNHVQLLNACYPTSSALLNAGPNYAPNSHELSRLTYYASNNRGKLTKLGAELEKRLKAECRKTRNGNLRMRASLLITLSIFRALAECKRDIALLSPFLVASVETTLSSLRSDLEVTVRATGVFTAWTTYTDGHLVGADNALTENYLSSLRAFASLSGSDVADPETRNRARLIGLIALTAALSSEALYNDFVQFRAQISVILKPILSILFQSDVVTLSEQAVEIKERDTISPSLAEFRKHPANERRAASIHIHVDGDKGPSNKEVSEAALGALFSLLTHANSPQLGFIMQSTCDNLDELGGWTKVDHCCWLAQNIADWAQYQYRYVVPTWLVERLLEHQSSTVVTPMHQALATMVTTVLSSSTQMINLSSSDILSNLTTILLRRSSVDPEDALIPLLERCIASLGTHVYYSDQIQDLAGELITRLVTVEIQGVSPQGKHSFSRSRSTAIRAILSGLSGLIETANKSDTMALNNAQSKSRSNSPTANRSSRDLPDDARTARRTRVPADIWQDTLSLICDRDSFVRMNYTNTLIYYVTHEMPKYGDSPSSDGTRRARKLAEGPIAQAVKASAFLHPGDTSCKLLHTLYAYYYTALTCPVLGLTSHSSPVTSAAVIEPTANVSIHVESLNDTLETNRRLSISPSQVTGRPSFSISQGPRDKKVHMIQQYLKRASSRISTSPAASHNDIQNALKVLRAVQEQVPIRALLASVPMLLALQQATRACHENSDILRWVLAIDEMLTRVWHNIGTVWNVPEVVQMAEQSLETMKVSFIAQKPPLSEDAFITLQEFSWNQSTTWVPIDGEMALRAIISNETVLSTLSIDRETLSRRLTIPWTPEAALNDLERMPGFESSTIGGDGVSPLLKISPALMHMNNMSLQSLARSTRGLGVTDLREALEGRSSMSNPALARPPSISTLDHASSLASGENGIRLTRSRSRNRSKKHGHPAGAGDVRDVLSKLGIGKQNGNLLKASFSAVQKPDPR